MSPFGDSIGKFGACSTSPDLPSFAPRDLEMYAVLVYTLERRVRLLESAVNASVWGCNSQIK